MTIRHIIALFPGIILNIISTEGASYCDSVNVFKKITSNYSKEMRPVLNQSDTIHVLTFPLLRSIDDFNEVTGTLSVIMVVTAIWTDELLRWDPDDYGGFKEMVIPQKSIWKPDLFLINPAKTLVPLGNDEFKIRLNKDGVAIWYTGGDIKTSCSPDMTYFPFDVQTCNMIIAAWGFSMEEINLLATGEVDTTNVTDNGSWKLKEASYKVYKMGASVVEVTLKLQRKPLYYILTLLFPIISLCGLNPMVFTLPYECGERVSFCITVLLSFAVFMTLTGDIIPKVSEPFPLVCVYLFIVQTFSGIITTANGLIFRAYHHDDDDEMSLFLWKIVTVLGKLFGCPNRCRKKSVIKPTNNKYNEKNDLDSEANRQKDSDQGEREVTKTSWKTVALTMDRVMFIISYVCLSLISLAFIVHLAVQGSSQ